MGELVAGRVASGLLVAVAVLAGDGLGGGVAVGEGVGEADLWQAVIIMNMMAIHKFRKGCFIFISATQTHQNGCHPDGSGSPASHRVLYFGAGNLCLPSTGRRICSARY